MKLIVKVEVKLKGTQDVSKAEEAAKVIVEEVLEAADFSNEYWKRMVHEEYDMKFVKAKVID